MAQRSSSVSQYTRRRTYSIGGDPVIPHVASELRYSRSSSTPAVAVDQQNAGSSSRAPNGPIELQKGTLYNTIRCVGDLLVEESSQLRSSTVAPCNWVPVFPFLSGGLNGDLQIAHTISPPLPFYSAAPFHSPPHFYKLLQSSLTVQCSIDTLQRFLTDPGRIACRDPSTLNCRIPLTFGDGMTALVHTSHARKFREDQVLLTVLRRSGRGGSSAAVEPSRGFPSRLLKVDQGPNNSVYSFEDSTVVRGSGSPLATLTCVGMSVDDPFVPLCAGYTRTAVRHSSFFAAETSRCCPDRPELFLTWIYSGSHHGRTAPEKNYEPTAEEVNEVRDIMLRIKQLCEKMERPSRPMGQRGDEQGVFRATIGSNRVGDELIQGRRCSSLSSTSTFGPFVDVEKLLSQRTRFYNTVFEAMRRSPPVGLRAASLPPASSPRRLPTRSLSPEPRAPSCHNFSLPKSSYSESSDVPFRPDKTSTAAPHSSNVISSSFVEFSHLRPSEVMAFQRNEPASPPDHTPIQVTSPISLTRATSSVLTYTTAPRQSITVQLPAFHHEAGVSTLPCPQARALDKTNERERESEPSKARVASHDSAHRSPSSALPSLSITLQGCTALPAAPYQRCVTHETPAERRADVDRSSHAVALYVTIRSSAGPHFRGPSHAYETNVRFTPGAATFYCPVLNPEEDVLTLTVVVELSSGKRLRLAIAKMAVCNLYDSTLAPLILPLVGNAGSSHASERGQLELTAQALHYGLSRDIVAEVEEPVLRRMILQVLRSSHREVLESSEVYVRRYCMHSLKRIHILLTRLRQRGSGGTVDPSQFVGLHADTTDPQPTLHEGSPSRALHNEPTAWSVPRCGRVTPCTLREPSATANALENAERATRIPVKWEPQSRGHRASSVPLQRPQRVGKGEAHRSASVAAVAVVKATVPAATAASVEVVLTKVSNLRGADGLPLFTCGCVCVELEVLHREPSTPHPKGNKSHECSTRVVSRAASPYTTYEDHVATFGDGVTFSLLLVSPRVDVLRISLWVVGSAQTRELIGRCEASLTYLDAKTGMGGSTGQDCGCFGLILIRQAGTSEAMPCGLVEGQMLLVRGTPAQHQEVVQKQKLALRERLLAFLWSRQRVLLHRYDVLLNDAAVRGMSAFLRGYSDENKEPPYTSLRIHLQQIQLARSGEVPATTDTALAAFSFPSSSPAYTHVSIVVTCGRHYYRTRSVRTTSNSLCATDHERPVTVDEVIEFEGLGALADRLCITIFDNGNRKLAAVQVPLSCLCDSISEVVQLPLIWLAGERGARERGFIEVEFGAAGVSFRRPSEGRWPGFSPQWLLRQKSVRLLHCFASQQLSALLPLLATVKKGNEEEDRFLRRLSRYIGTEGGVVEMVVQLVGLRYFPPDVTSCYVKAYHQGRALLRTGSLACDSSVAGFSVDGVVPLRDASKYVFRVATDDPHHDTVVLKIGRERILSSNIALAYAELSLASFCDLERQCGVAKKHIPKIFWLPLVNEASNLVGELGVTVTCDNLKLTPGLGHQLATKGTQYCSAAFPTPSLMRDLYSLLHAYRPQELFRLHTLFSRFLPPLTSHRMLCKELLGPRYVCTLYVEIIGFQVAQTASAAEVMGKDGQLTVSVSCGPSSCGTTASCPLLSPSASGLAIAEYNGGTKNSNSPCYPSTTARLDLPHPSTEVSDAENSMVYPLTLTLLRTPHQHAARMTRRSHSSSALRRNPLRLFRSQSAVVHRGSQNTSSFYPSKSGSCSTPLTLIEPSTVANRGQRLPQFSSSPQRATSTCSSRRSPSMDVRVGDKAVEVGGVAVSLMAFLTPSIYRPGSPVSVPIVALPHQLSSESPRSNSVVDDGVVCGQLHFRIRVADSDGAPPSWLSFSANAVHDLLQREPRASCLPQMLEQRVRQLTRGNPSALHSLHYDYFHPPGSAPTRLLAKRITEKQEAPAHLPSALRSVREEVNWRLQRVTRISDGKQACVNEPVAVCNASLDAWISEGDGITVVDSQEDSSFVDPTEVSRMKDSITVAERTRRELIF